MPITFLSLIGMNERLRVMSISGALAEMACTADGVIFELCVSV